MYTITDSLGHVEIGDGRLEPSRSEVDRVNLLFKKTLADPNGPHREEVRELFSKSESDPQKALLLERARYQFLRDMCQSAKKREPWALNQLRNLKSRAEFGDPMAQKFWSQAQTIGCPSI